MVQVDFDCDRASLAAVRYEQATTEPVTSRMKNACGTPKKKPATGEKKTGRESMIIRRFSRISSMAIGLIEKFNCTWFVLGGVFFPHTIKCHLRLLGRFFSRRSGQGESGKKTPIVGNC